MANGAFNAAVAGTILARVVVTEQARCWAAYRWIVTCCLVTGYGIGGAAGTEHSVAALVLTGILVMAGAAGQGGHSLATRATTGFRGRGTE